EKAAGDIVAFTDDDAVVDPWWLLELARCFNSERVAAVTGMILPAELETPSQFWLEQYGGFSKGFRKRLFDIYENRPNDRLFPYGVGLTAYLTRTLAKRPRRLIEFARRVPEGAAYVLSPASAKNMNKGSDYPAELTWLERRGMLYGPMAYCRSLLQSRFAGDG